MDHCSDKPYCWCCGDTNYRWLGYLGAIARWAKAWGVSKEEAEKRMNEKYEVDDEAE